MCRSRWHALPRGRQPSDRSPAWRWMRSGNCRIWSWIWRWPPCNSRGSTSPTRIGRRCRRHLSDLARDAVTGQYGIGDDLGARAGGVGRLAGRALRLCRRPRVVRRPGQCQPDPGDPAPPRLAGGVGRSYGCTAPAPLGGTRIGVNFPGHFLIALGAGSNQLVLDVFDGGEPLDTRALRAIDQSGRGCGRRTAAGLVAADERPCRAAAAAEQHQAAPAARRRPGRGIGRDGGHAARRPGAAPLWRDAAVLHQRLEQVAAALRCYQRFLALVPRGEAADEVRAIIDGLRAQLN